MNSTPAKLFSIVLSLSAGLLSGCQPDTKSAQAWRLPVQAKWQHQHLNCQQPLVIANHSWQLQNLRFYLSDFMLDQQAISLTTGPWQQAQVALLGTDCQGNSNWQLEFSQPLVAGELQFTLGLPFTINHQNPLLASAPLNHSELFWSWQLGYKFLRFELQSPDHGWAFHLGSTGCQSASVLRPPIVPCRAANTVTVSLNYQPGQQLQLNLAALLAGISLQADNSCMSDSQQPSCRQLFANLLQPLLWQLDPGFPP